MRRNLERLGRYVRICAIVFGCGFAISAFLWVPLSLGLILWFGGSAISAHSYGRNDALVSHGQWTSVSPKVFHTVMVAEILAISSILTTALTIPFVWRARRRKDS